MTLLNSTINYPHPVLTPIKSRPTFESLRLLTQEVAGNAYSVRSPLGGGAHGLLVLVLPAQDYQDLAGKKFESPKDPGPVPILNPFGTGKICRTKFRTAVKNRPFRLRKTMRSPLTVSLEFYSRIV